MTNYVIGSRYEMGKTLLKVLLVFFIVFSIRFQGSSWFLSPRIVSMITIVFLFNWKTISRITSFRVSYSDFGFILSSTFVFIYSWLITLANGVGTSKYTMIDSTLNFLVFVVIFPLLSIDAFTDSFDFCRILLFASSIQALIVFLSTFSRSFRSLLESIQAVDVSRYDWRIIGLGIAGAGGSVYLFCGLIAGIYLLISNRKNTFILFCTVMLLFAIALVGRTGFYASLILLSYFLLLNSRSIKKKVKNIVSIVFLIVVILSFFAFLSSIITESEIIQYTFQRLWELFREGFDSPTLRGINNLDLPVPGLSIQTLVGTGITRGLTSTGLLFMNDSGYVQRYAAIGLVMCVFSYLSFLIYMLKLILRTSSDTRNFLLLCLLILFLIEYKEPFIYMLAYPFTLIMISKLQLKHPLPGAVQKGRRIRAGSKCSTDNI